MKRTPLKRSGWLRRGGRLLRRVGLRRQGKRFKARLKQRQVWRGIVLQRAGYRCERCHRASDFIHPHHLWRYGQGGPDEPWNGAALCAKCHRSIHEDIYIPDWGEWNARSPKQARAIRARLDKLL